MVQVVRDDLIEGGSKSRFLPQLIVGADEVVYGGPFCGGAPWALAVVGAEMGIRVTLFYAKRSAHHRRQKLAAAAGARLFEVSPGYLTVVQKRARSYAERAGALFLPLGFDRAEAEEPFLEVMAGVRESLGEPGEVWCATGSGMLARCLARAFPSSAVHGVAVGLKSRWSRQSFPPNVQIHEASLRFEQESRAASPFPSCPNYDRKAWELCAKLGSGRRLFWNVAE